jgi:hypothetical protein
MFFPAVLAGDFLIFPDVLGYDLSPNLPTWERSRRYTIESVFYVTTPTNGRIKAGLPPKR